MRVLVLGGYGGFGARLSRRLATDGWQVLVAGRSKTAAAALAAQLPGASALVVDRMGDLEIILRQERPFLLIDAAGPFQGDDGRVVRACIAERVHYIDLADARDFVGAIGAFDAAARAAGIAVISGGSSVPALSGAVVEELAAGMDAVHCVDMSISASNRATAGASVARAILSYVGRPIELWRGRRCHSRADPEPSSAGNSGDCIFCRRSACIGRPSPKRANPPPGRVPRARRR